MYGSGKLHLSIKKEASGTFPLACLVTALPVSYRRRLTLCTAVSTWSPRFTSHDLYLHCRSLASRAKRSFYFGPPKINGSNSTVSFSVLCCFRSTGCLLLTRKHERMYLLSINTKEGGTQNTCSVPCSLV